MTAKSKTERSRAAVRDGYPLTRIRTFFRENPHEILSKEDMCVKFNVTRHQLDNLLRVLNTEGIAYRRVMVCGKEAV